MDFHHHDRNGPPLQERIGWRGTLAFFAGLILFAGLSFALFGDSKAGFVVGASAPSLIWLAILYAILDEDGDYSAPDSMEGLPSEAELDAMEATSDEVDDPSFDPETTRSKGDVKPIEEEVDW